jgi:hypothetical protein
MFTTGNSKNSTSTISSAVNGIAKATNSALGAVNTAAASTVAAVNSLATGTAKAVNSAATNAVKAVNSALPSANSLMPFANAAKNGKPANNSGKNSNILHNAYNNFKNVGVNSLNTAANSGKSGWGMMFGLVLFLTATFLLAMFVFQNEFNTAWDYLTKTIQKLFKKDVPTNETPDDLLKEEEGNIMKAMPGESDKAAGGLLNKILPMGTKEVFNVSLNDYSYYDAEPLCLALGAELASYEQVKEAWNKGADWCNYGWTKGQLAIYPTQKETWEKLQHGPLDEKGACGRPGVNGGYFDNPEMRFGVNCYGVKPDQSANDERVLMENGTIPKTASTLKMNKQIEEIKENIDMVGILPFSGTKWSA